MMYINWCILYMYVYLMLLFTPTGALCYAELGTIILKSGAEYVYLYEAFGGIPAYIFAWSSTLVFKPPQISIIAITFGAYMAESLIPAGCGTTVVVAKLFAVLAICKFWPPCICYGKPVDQLLISCSGKLHSIEGNDLMVFYKRPE